MRLAIVTGSLSRLAGGLFESVRNSAKALHSAGVEVTVFGLRDRHTDEDSPAWQPLVPVALSPFGPLAIGYSPRLLNELVTADVDLVHQHGIWQSLSYSVSRWRKKTGRPVMISTRGMLDSWALKNSAWKKRLALLAFESANIYGASCLHALNEAEYGAARSFGFRGPVALIPNGIELLSSFGEAPYPDWIPDDGRKAMLFLGRIHPKKGIEQLLEAWALVKLTYPDPAQNWRLVVAGWDDGGHIERLVNKVRQLNLTEDVVFPGPLHGAEKAAALRSATAFILPSYSEGLPMAVLEAWSYSLPVLMTEACNLPEGFLAGAAAYIHLAPDEMARDIGRFICSTDADLKIMGMAGRKLVSSKFQWSQIAEKHIEAYRWIASGCSREDAPDFIKLGL